MDKPSTTGRESVLTFATAVPVERLLTTGDLPATALPDPADPTVFESHPPHYFRAMISNQKIDSYFTRMHSSSLMNYAADATAGVSFQNSHREGEMGFGRSYRGEYLGSEKNGSARTEVDFYTIPGLNLNGVNTSDLILGMRAGIVKDVSVGFYGGTMRCTVCNRTLWSGDCWHIPGLRYDKAGEMSDDPNAATAVAWVHDAHLAEVSAVYDGSCPGAAIMKARQVAAAGHLRPEAARLLEARYRIRLTDAGRAWPGVDSSPRKEAVMPDQQTTAPPLVRTLEERVQELGRALSVPEGTDPLARALELTRSLSEAKAENSRLTPLAEMGRLYHTALLEETLAEGVRGGGATFPLEAQRAVLSGASIEQLQTIKRAYATQADALLSGGRVTSEQGEPPPGATEPAHYTPRGAFAG